MPNTYNAGSEKNAILDFFKCLCIYILTICLLIQGNSRKGSGDVASAVCYTIYTIYRSLCTQTAETPSVLYGLLPLDLFPKLTEEDKGYLYLSLLVEGRAASAGSDHIRSLYSTVKAYNLVYIITQ